MGKHVFTLNLRMEVDTELEADQESNKMLTVSPDLLLETVNLLRSEILSNAEELSASEFEEVMEEAKSVNAVLGVIENICDDIEYDEAVESELLS